MEREELWYWLLNMETIGPVMHRRLLEHCGSPEEIWKTDAPPLPDKQKEEFFETRRKMADLQREYEQMKKKGIRMITIEDSEYPSRLKSLYDSPYGVFVRGKLPDEDQPAVAIVGARKCTPHGSVTASRVAGELAGYGAAVISGMAAGIDGYSHRGALDAGGYTLAVLGCGIDICYPSSHRKLYQDLIERGGILSEYGPGKAALAWRFPLRNRLISGLSNLVLVVEAREKSGSLITVDQALEQGREVMAVPGRPDDILSHGCNRLIREGAGLCTCGADVMAQLGIETEKLSSGIGLGIGTSGGVGSGGVKGNTNINFCDLTSDEQHVLACLSAESKHMDRIAAETGLPVSVLAGILIRLELKGCVHRLTAGQYQRIR